MFPFTIADWQVTAMAMAKSRSLADMFGPDCLRNFPRNTWVKAWLGRW